MFLYCKTISVNVVLCKCFLCLGTVQLLRPCQYNKDDIRSEHRLSQYPSPDIDLVIAE